MDHTEKQVSTVEEGSRPSQAAQLPTMIDDDPALLSRAEVLHGKFPSHERVRLIRPSRPSFKQISSDMLQATEIAIAPRGGAGRIFYHIKRALIGAPIANSEAEHERLTKFKALAVLSSDAISSVAYATEACLMILFTAGVSSQGLTTVLPISLAIIALLAIVAISYRQTIPAYPNGGGSYIVAKDNLGNLPGLIAASSLLIDYVLTVSVSVASGVLNFAALFHGAIDPYLVPIEVGLVIFITVVNLRGVRESGSFFAIPTYFFIVCAFALILMGLIKGYVFDHQPIIAAFPANPNPATPLTFFLILRAFASGCSAMTGVEAISNGVPAFQKPETKNAAKTLTAMALILGSLFAGITLLTLTYAPHIFLDPSGSNTLIAQISQQVFSHTPVFFMFYVFQIATLLILVLAANTSYSDFPRLASLLARDNFLPHQFAFRGDRLAFSTGIVFLAILASTLLIVLNGDISRLIDLYAVGVFMSFTLSQSGMVRHWWRLRASEPGWQRKLSINALGALVTCVVAVIIASTKFLTGAWIVVILIPLLVLVFSGIHAHYTRVESERTTGIPTKPAEIQHLFVVPIAGMDRVSVQSLAYARSISAHVIAVHVAVDVEDAHRVREAWKMWRPNIADDEKTELVIIESPYRSLFRPLIDYIDTVHELFPDYTLTVLLPEFIVAHWWEHFLHNQTALQLKAALLFRPGIVVTSVPQHLPHRSQMGISA
ncbi:APC family permease [Tengunoibacter tsumagoiensis]|nr:APC family permease [Tengunoibacter tsumagoiensis]